MKIKKRILTIILAVVVLGMALVLSSCDILDIFKKKEGGTAPSITKVTMLKDSHDYLNSKEYLYNKDSGNAMPINSKGTFLLSIEYDNPSKYSISYVKVNNEKIMASKFADGSNRDNTIIAITVSESKTALSETYTVNSIFYNTGSETKRMAFNDEYDMTFNVVVEPSFYLTLDYQNADRRAASQTSNQTAARQLVAFNAELYSYSVVDKDYSTTVGVPAKAGGWVFEGYYTKPNGGGELVKGNDRYYFWEDTVLYAYFSRLYTYEIVSLHDEIGLDQIVYEYSGSTKTFYSGVIITGDTKKGHPILDLGDTMVDETVKVDENTGRVTVTAVEYPIIKVGKRAFNNVNTLITLNIGRYIREIGYYAFNNCNALERVNFSSNSTLQAIGDFAFQSTKLMGITYPFTIPDTVTYLGNFAFRYSGWQNTITSEGNRSILHIKPQYTFVGTGCFFGTQFEQVIFDPGCYYDTQIDRAEADELEKSDGWQTIDLELNRIGANIFGNCKLLKMVTYENKVTNGVVALAAANIIPDRAYDGGNYTISGLTALILKEGVEKIGEEAFNYQMVLPELVLPASIKEIGKKAFYNNINTAAITFTHSDANKSQLTTLYSMAFGNMASLSRIVIPSNVFSKYGNGPFSGCGNLKSIEFPNIGSTEQVPMGFSKSEKPDEVYVGHNYSDFLFGTFESGELEESGTGTDEAPVTYSVPTRIFCNSAVLQQFKTNIELGKELTAGGTSTGTRAYRDTIFVYDIGLIFRNYIDPKQTNPEPTDIALQAVYNTGDTVIGYSLAFWSARSKIINIPSSLELTIAGNTQQRTIIEIGMYSMPTSAQQINVPATVKRLEHDAFNNCTALHTVTFENKDTLEYIGENAFMGTVISSFEGGSNLKAIGQYAFWKCRNLVWVDLSACTSITNVKNGRIGLKTQYKFEYEKTAIAKAATSDKDAVDYQNSLHYGAFQGCINLTWIYLPPNIMRMSRSLLDNCPKLATVIIANPNIPTYNSPVDENEQCFYENAQATTVYDTEALARGMIIYGVNIPNHQNYAFTTGIYKTIDDTTRPQRPSV